jgi:hypothetical protein
VVTEGVFDDEQIIFDAVTPEWTAFCSAALGFSPPPGEAQPRGTEES